MNTEQLELASVTFPDDERGGWFTHIGVPAKGEGFPKGEIRYAVYGKDEEDSRQRAKRLFEILTACHS
jgi:hypothetical protein